jgi:hypothetical protein
VSVLNCSKRREKTAKNDLMVDVIGVVSYEMRKK